jgi:hypothetical protein
MSDDDVVQIPVVATVSCLAYRERIHQLETERDQLREALEKMLDPEKAGVVTYEIGVMQDIARSALKEFEQ